MYINLWALDEDFKILSLLSYVNLQWNRKYYSPGSFSVRIPVEQYNAGYKYIYSKDRDEVGEIVQVNYIKDNTGEYINISGYFLEKMLDRFVVYPYGTTNIANPPNWKTQSGVSEDVALKLFNDFSEISGHSLPISAEESQHRGNNIDYERQSGYLGSLMYDILKASELSLKVIYDYENDQRKLEVYEGVDRTSENVYGNNPVVFSTRYGNLTNINMVTSNEKLKNGGIITATVGDTNVVRMVVDNADDISFASLKSSLKRDDYATANDFYNALDNDCVEQLQAYEQKINIGFDALEGSYQYLEDFDLGDKCSIEIPEIGISAEARIVACYEVIKDGNWTLELEIGTPLIK